MTMPGVAATERFKGKLRLQFKCAFADIHVALGNAGENLCMIDALDTRGHRKRVEFVTVFAHEYAGFLINNLHGILAHQQRLVVVSQGEESFNESTWFPEISWVWYDCPATRLLVRSLNTGLI